MGLPSGPGPPLLDPGVLPGFLPGDRAFCLPLRFGRGGVPHCFCFLGARGLMEAEFEEKVFSRLRAGVHFLPASPSGSRTLRLALEEKPPLQEVRPFFVWQEVHLSTGTYSRWADDEEMAQAQAFLYKFYNTRHHPFPLCRGLDGIVKQGNSAERPVCCVRVLRGRVDKPPQPMRHLGQVPKAQTDFIWEMLV